MPVPFTHFAELEIVIGTITEVSIVPDADRLLKLAVDVGEESPRQVVSGIREYVVDEQSLVGKQCPFIINLEPRTIKGYESQAMILAAHHEDVFSFLVPDATATVPAGTPIR